MAQLVPFRNAFLLTNRTQNLSSQSDNCRQSAIARVSSSPLSHSSEHPLEPSCSPAVSCKLCPACCSSCSCSCYCEGKASRRLYPLRGALENDKTGERANATSAGGRGKREYQVGERSRFSRIGYRTKILSAVGGFMALTDLKPLPIPSLVRYQLIDSSSVRSARVWLSVTTTRSRGTRHGFCHPE